MKKKMAMLLALTFLLGMVLGGCSDATKGSSAQVISRATIPSSAPVSSKAPSSAVQEVSSVVSLPVSSSSTKPASNVVQPDVVLESDMRMHATVRADGGLNMRTGPGTNYEVIVLVPDGAEVAEAGYQKNDGDWMYIVYEGEYGWVSTEYLIYQGGMAKPVIYLYPQKKMDVEVKVEFENGYFTCTYPDYGTGWKVTASPDGTLVNKADGREYSYLYWEGEGAANYDMSKGFVVKGEDTAAFLREKLAYMGLTPREYNEFIVYWLPLMQENAYNLITFQGEAYTNNARLAISPKPDSLLRVFMVYQPLSASIDIPPQKLAPFTREGFSVVEWGGTMLGS